MSPAFWDLLNQTPHTNIGYQCMHQVALVPTFLIFGRVHARFLASISAIECIHTQLVSTRLSVYNFLQVNRLYKRVNSKNRRPENTEIFKYSNST